MSEFTPDTSTLPDPVQVPFDGCQEVLVPVMLRINVDPLDGFTDEEAISVALERLADLRLEVYLGGVPIPVHAKVPLFGNVKSPSAGEPAEVIEKKLGSLCPSDVTPCSPLEILMAVGDVTEAEAKGMIDGASRAFCHGEQTPPASEGRE